MLLNIYNRSKDIFVRGQGINLYDSEDNEYLDLVSGIAVNTLGHCSPVIAKTIEEQGKKLIHLSNLYNTREQGELAEKLVGLSDHSKVFFCNSGTEAVECALKIGRKYGKSKGQNKSKILYMKNSFHGRSMGALSVTGQPKYQKEFLPLVGNTQMCEFNDIEDIKSKISGACAVILEPIQGESGLIQADKKFLEEVRELCDKWGSLLIFDEIQCGIGRLGTFFAYEKFGVIPDVVCMAKGLGGGIPIGAVLVNDRADVLTPGDHGTTFGGNPFACAVGATIINELIDNKVLENVKTQSVYLDKVLNSLMEKYSVIDEVRGMGLLKGLKLKESVNSFVEAAYEKNILVVGAGDNVVRIIPPLNIDGADMASIEEKLNIVFEKYGEAL